MARHKRSRAPEEDEPGLDISSLIDVTFLLLIYFLVATTIQKSETDLGMALPSRGEPSSEQPDIPPMFIRVDSAGAIYTGTGAAQTLMDSDPAVRAVPNLSAHLEVYAAAAAASGSQPLVQVYVEADAVQQRVVDVLNALAGADIRSVTFTDLIE